MMRTTIHAAKTDLSRLIKKACAGEEVVIARGDTPVVRLVPFKATPRQTQVRRPQGQGPDDSGVL